MESNDNKQPSLNREKHIRYHLRCLKTLLPTLYTSNDSNRMLLAFLTLNALDLLSVLEPDSKYITADERQGFIDWLYRCQLETGGFRGFTGADAGPEWRQQHPNGYPGAHWDPANVAGTFFALVSLVVLGDDWSRVHRRETLAWLHRLQWTDGSLGEFLGPDGLPVGARDIRFCYLAAATRYMLRSEEDQDIPDLDVDLLAEFVLSSQAYDGGFGKQPMHEGNAGWTYCAVACLELLEKLPSTFDASQTSPEKSSGNSFSMPRLLHWLASLQIPCPECSDSEEESATEDSSAPPTENDRLIDTYFTAVGSAQWRCAGLNGRFNKPADTCYSFWAGGALEILGHTAFIDKLANRRYLLERTQHLIGGFGKTDGDPPDILHSSLGLAALSLMQEPGIQKLEPVLCLSVKARQRLDNFKSTWHNAATK